MLEITLKSPYQFAHILFQPTIVPHSGHYHFIPESDLSAGELAAAKV
ncbi:histidine triad protein B [Streptococcus pneumoniae]|nr:histidine triad protein B [Streptococcus pneumoniae]ARD36832.1 histidine triad protein B [Streptococcus pneumoniae]